jgi:hypothetical protein
MDPEKSPLAKASVKLKHPEPYSGGSDLEEFEGFIANILRWLKMNYLLGLTSIDLQVSYLGTCLTGEAQEWFHRNVPRFDRQVQDWTLETVVQGTGAAEAIPAHPDVSPLIEQIRRSYAGHKDCTGAHG